MKGLGYKSYTKYFKASAEKYKKLNGIVKKGETIIWSAHVLHGGDPIVDPSRSRLSQVTHYYFDDCMYWSPIQSDPEIGKFQLRRPYDISEDRFIENKFNGHTVRVSLRERLNGPYYNFKKFTPSK